MHALSWIAFSEASLGSGVGIMCDFEQNNWSRLIQLKDNNQSLQSFYDPFVGCFFEFCNDWVRMVIKFAIQQQEKDLFLLHHWARSQSYLILTLATSRSFFIFVQRGLPQQIKTLAEIAVS